MDTNIIASGASIHPPEPNIFLFTDASHSGWGAHLEPMRLSFHGCWSEDQSQLHIKMLEMMAICLALNKALKYIQHSCVMISTDNKTVVSYINKQGGTHSPNRHKKSPLVSGTQYRDQSFHIPGKFNILADRLSRLDRPLKTEWFWISQKQTIFQMLSYPNMDLFVTRFDHKPSLGGSVGCASDWRPGGHRFDPC